MGGVGPAILADGSNINPVALRLLQLRRPDGGYLIPTPQTVNARSPSRFRDRSTVTTPSTFDEDQFIINLDWLYSSSSRLSGRVFVADGATLQAIPAGNVEGFPLTIDDKYVAASANHSWVLGSHLFNEARFGYGLLETNRTQESAFTFSSVGVTSSSQNDDLPIINISGSFNLASSPVGRRTQKTFIIDDSLTWVRGRHSLQMGGGFTRAMRDFSGFRQPGQLVFQTFPDFLLGLSAAQNGTNLFSNIVTSVDLTGLFDRESRNWEGAAYFQDTFRVSPRLTLNMGLRWEYLPPLTDALGRPTTVDQDLLDPNPPCGRLTCRDRRGRELSRKRTARRHEDGHRERHRSGRLQHLGTEVGRDLARSRELRPRGGARRLRHLLFADDRSSADPDHDDAAIRTPADLGGTAERRCDFCESFSGADPFRSPPSRCSCPTHRDRT